MNVNVAKPHAKKRGRPGAVDSAFALRWHAAGEMRRTKMQRRLSTNGLNAQLRKCGHSEHEIWSPNDIVKLRLYFWRLPKADQRHFLSAGVRCDLDRERIAKGGDLSNLKLYTNFRLERPSILEERLTMALMDPTYRLPDPCVSECRGVCQEFLLRAVGRSIAFFNQSTPKVKSRSGPMSEADCVFATNPIRKVFQQRLALKAKYVTDWLDKQREEHLVMPNEDATVLPYVDRREAHALFVVDTERLLQFEHADKSRDLCFSSCLAMADLDDSVDEGVLDEEAILRVNALAQARPAMSRYGNICLGLRTELPVHKDVASATWFRHVWEKFEDCNGKRYKETAKIRKWMPFAKCDQCSVHRERMSKTRDPAERKKLKAIQALHLERVRRERLSYAVRQRLSHSDPDRYLSVIIDGADSSPYMIPHFCYRSHRTDATPKVKMHVLGAIVHGRGTYAFTCPPHIAQGHNVTIQVLHEILVATQRIEGKIPPILNLQLDNTTKQNKGKYLVGYLGFLLRSGVIKEAYMNFLPVGHTHEDIDQFFSRVSTYSRRMNILTPSDLCQAIRCCYKKYGMAPIVKQWKEVANVSAYFQPYLTKDLSKDITLYYQLRIIMGRAEDVSGVPIMQARSWPGSPEDDPQDFWRGLQEDSSFVRIFKAGRQPDLCRERLRVPPQAQPQHVGKDAGTPVRLMYTEALAKQRSMIEVLMNVYSRTFTAAKRAEVIALLDALGSNLDPHRPVQFNWDAEQMHTVYNQGTYLDQDQAPPSSGVSNLFGSVEEAKGAPALVPDGMRDPEAFANALQSGDVDPRNVENCHACVLVVGSFYIQRPDDGSQAPVRILCVKRVIQDPENLARAWGAWVQEWELSCSADPGACYITDPWHAIPRHANGQRYNEKKSLKEQTWGYDTVPLDGFQDEGTFSFPCWATLGVCPLCAFHLFVVTMVKWNKPAGWAKEFNCGEQQARGVVKKKLESKCQNRVRNYIFSRWNAE